MQAFVLINEDKLRPREMKLFYRIIERNRFKIEFVYKPMVFPQHVFFSWWNLKGDVRGTERKE